MVNVNVLTAVEGENQLTNENIESYELALLEEKFPVLVHDQAANKDSVPIHGGTTKYYRRYDRLTPSSSPTPLTEGSPGSKLPLSVTKISSTPQQYGHWIELTDRLILQGIDDNVMQSVKLIGKLDGETKDTIVKNKMATFGAVQYQGGKTAVAEIDSSSRLTLTGVRKAVRTLEHLLNRAFPDGYYICYLDSYSAFDIQNDPEWKEKVKYADPQRMIRGEIGNIDGIKFVKTQVGYVQTGAGATTDNSVMTTNGKADVYCTFVVAPNAYGVTGVGKKDMDQNTEIIIKQLGSGGTSDPLNQVATVGCKDMIDAVELDEDNMVRIYHAVGA